MKALSLWQIWASLIALNLKRFETRSWSTSYRGPLAIHAAQRWTAAEREFAFDLTNDFNLTVDLMHPPLGAVLCICNLTHIGKTEEVYPRISALERAVGNYEPGRFAWRLEVVEVFEKPIPAQGKQGLWNWERPTA